jgi:diguanylate cyclase (GGDEF)-like protein
MFWRKSSAEAVVAQPAPPAPAPASDEAFDAAIDGASAILKALGKYSFAIEDEEPGDGAAPFEKCAAHVLVMAPLDGQSTGPDGRARQRHWPTVVRTVTDRRKREQAYVEQTTKEAREAIQALVAGVGRACIETHKSGGAIRDQAARLEHAASTDSLAELKREATAFVSVVVSHLEAQRERLAEQTRDLRERLSKLQVELADARREGGTDALTQVANRRTFDTTIDRQIQYSAILARPLSLILVDIDHFKSVNDRYGHPAGDKVLREVANVLVRQFPRRSDLVARYGGEEFACVLPETALEDARMLADRMRVAIRGKTIDLGETKLTVTISAGVASLAEGDATAELIERADKALYAAKHGGRDCVGVSGGGMSGVHRAVDVGAGPRSNGPVSRRSRP